MTRRNIGLITIALFVIILSVQVIGSTQRNNGEFIYPIDDTYIHLAIARNFADYGVWGIDRYGFSSTSSSLLYSGVLSLSLTLFGNFTTLPFILNIVFAFLMLFTFYKLASKDGLDNLVYFLGCLLLILLVPLPSMVLSGMEHVMHALLSVSFSVFAARNLAHQKGSFIPVLVLAPLIATVRYEGLFLIGIVAFLFLVNRHFKASFLTLFAGLLPIAVFGVISVLNGSHFLPNTILAKSYASSLAGGSFFLFIINTADNFLYHISRLFLTVPIVVCGVLLYQLRHQKRSFFYQYTLITLLLILSHSAFARVGRFDRYEAYLVAQVIVVVMYGYYPLRNFLGRLSAKKWVTALVLILLFLPVAKRSFDNYWISVQASQNIYEQQIQMARFIKSLPGDITLMANDIGALAYFNPELHMVDMVGLGSVDVLNMLKSSGSNDERKAGYVKIAENHSADIAIIYDHWFRGQIPEDWKKIETWTIKNNVICGHTTVSFYSLKPGLTAFFEKSLDKFPLPPTVIRSVQ